LKKAVKIGMVRVQGPLVEKFKLIKSIGFDGVELNSPSDLKLDEVLAAREESGLPIHGVVDSVHWQQTLSHPDASVRAAGLEGLKTALKDAKAYGATSVLLVPAVVNKQVSYSDAYTRSQAELKQALPLAEELGIKILFENVWNNFLLSPLEMARYIDEFGSPQVGAYFDVGNIVRYGWPEHWIRTLGKRIGKLDIKEYSRELENTKGPRAGFAAEIGEGDCDWPAVMQALSDIGFQGWATAEVAGGDEPRLRDIAARMDRAFAATS
jgi:hexulose-6-phosphate isomerase